VFLKGDLVYIKAFGDSQLYAVIDIEEEQVVLRDMKMEEPQLIVGTSAIERFEDADLDLLVHLHWRVQALQIAITDTETFPDLRFLRADVDVREIEDRRH